LTATAATLADSAFWGASAAGISGNASDFSADSQLIAFESDAGNLTLNDFNGRQDIFVRDLGSGVTTLVSMTPDGVSGSAPSFNPQLSADGRYVLFESEAKDLVTNDTNGAFRDVFVRDLLNQTTTLVSVSVTGGSGNNHSSADFISQDGQLVGFHSPGTNFVTTSPLNQQNIYVRNLTANTTTLVTANFDGTGSDPDSFGVNKARLSPDNRFVVFDSAATNLVENDSNGPLRDVFIRDLQLNTTVLASMNDAGSESGNNSSYGPVFDPTGRYVAFASEARDLVPGNPFAGQVYLRDTLLNTTTLISLDNTYDGETARQTTLPFLAFSPDGRYVAYEGSITEIHRQIYVRDLINNTTLLVSANRFSDAGTSHLADGVSSRPSFSPDGETIYFASTASNLIDENTNGLSQIYARHLPTRTTSLLSRGIDTLPGIAASAFPVISSDGESLAFESQATNLVVDDNNRLKDLFVLNVATSEISLLTPRDPLQPLEYTSRTTVTDQPQPTGVSTDGRYIVFNSEAKDLVTNTVSGRNAYRHDRQSGTTELVSVNPDGSGGNNSSGVSGSTAVSADGRFVIFGSLDLTPVPGLQYAPGLPGGPRGLFVRDMQLGTTQVINRNSAGYVAGLGGERFMISPDGRYAVFATSQPLLAQDTNGSSDAYVFDLELNVLSLVSANSSGNAGNDKSTILQTSAVGEGHNIFSDDGRFLVFTSDATDLSSAGGTIGAIYVRDLEAGTTELASLRADGTAAAAFGHALSGDGSRLVFVTNARLVAEDTDNSFDVYVRDFTTDTTTLISPEVNSGATNPTISRNGQIVLYSLSGPTGISLIRRDLGSQTMQFVHTGSDVDYVSAVNEDGRYVAFLDTTVASNGLTSTSDMLFYDVQEQTTTVASLNHSSTAPANRGVLTARPQIDAVGSMVAFSSHSFDLIESDTNGRADVFYFLRPLGGGSLRGEVFSDANADGDHDVPEVGLAGWKVFLDTNSDGVRQNGETQVVTAANGQYAFTGLVPGTYRIVAEQRNAFVQSAPLSVTFDATIVADETVPDLDFGFQQQFADLQVDTIYLPVVSRPGETAMINWDVSNQGVFDATGNWQDAVYISEDAQLSPDDVLLGTKLHTGGLTIGDFYSDSLTASLPAVVPGDYYILILTDRRGQVLQDNRTNDILASSTTINLDVPELFVGVDLAGTLWGPGQRQYFKVVPPQDRSLTITLDSLATSGASAVYVSRGVMPAPGDFDFRGQSFEPDASLVIPRTVGQSIYYMMVEGQFGDAATDGFTLSARLPGMKIAQVSPNQGGNTGRVTVRIDGTELTPTTTVQIFNTTTTIHTVAIDYRDSSHLFATFDLSGAAMGSYDMFVSDGAANDLVFDAFEVIPGVEMPLVIEVIVPGSYRRLRTTSLIVEVRNDGNTDVTAPLLQLSSEAAYLSLSEQGDPDFPSAAPSFVDPFTQSKQFLAISQDGPAGILRPGETSRTMFRFNIPSFIAQDRLAPFSLEQPEDLGLEIDWDSQKDEQQPLFTGDEAWNVIWGAFTAKAGTTIADYQQMLANTATDLSRLGIRTSDPERLARAAMAEADSVIAGMARSDGADVATRGSGLGLSLSRISSQTLSGRYRLGPMGRGWTHGWEISIASDAQGDAVISQAGGVRNFVKVPNGTFESAPGDAAVLTLINGLYRLREVHGEIMTFRADGLLDSLEDRFGNIVTASYDANGLLQSLNHNSGDVLTFTYDTEGRLVEVADPTGESSVYTYDNEHLVRVETARGVTEYSYLNGDTQLREHAIASIFRPDGSQLFLEYDSFGRVIRTEYNNGENAINYQYGSSRQLTATDAEGMTVTAFFNDVGKVEFLQDGLGRQTSYNYDSDNHLSELFLPTGHSQLFDFCGCGSLLSTVDPKGIKESMTYDPEFRHLTSITDGAGNVTEYVRDDNGVLQLIQYADGSQESFSTDAQGNATGVTDRRGNEIAISYDASGQLLRKDFEDGTFQEYTYDARGNRLTASNNGDTIVMEYDTADRMTRMAYSNGRFLEFSYDAAGRRTRSIDQTGFEQFYEFDTHGRLSAMTDGTGALLVSYEFGLSGQLVRKNVGSGAFTTYAYDAVGQLSSLANHAPDGTISSQFEYAYGALGQVLSMTTLEGITNYTYDLSGQLTRIVLPSGRTLSYGYDDAGNRTRVVDSGVTTEYVTDIRNQYTSAGNTTYTYDADGNLATRTDSSGTTNFSFDVQGQLIAIVGPSGTTYYEYDALGNRVASTRDGARTEYLIDPAGLNTVVGEYDSSGAVLANYIQGAGLVGRADQTGLAYYDFDAVGNTAALTDMTGNILNEYQYLPFGEMTTQTVSVSNPFTFGGELGVIDEGDGFYQMRARFYDTGTGQFLSNDPLGQTAGGSINLRQYAFNNPVSFVDPSGFKASLMLTFLDGNPCAPHTEIFFSDGTSGFYGTVGSPNPLAVALVGQENAFGLAIGLLGQDGAFHYRKGEKKDKYTLLAEFDDEALLRRIIAEIDAERRPYTLNPLNGDSCLVNALRVRIRYRQREIMQWFIPNVFANDPNDITGPPGFGPENYTTSDHVFPYTIRFENDPEQATAPAQEVFVTLQLDDDLDWTTFELGDVGFGSMVISVPAGRNAFDTRVTYENQDGSDLLVDFQGALDFTTGIVTWTFRSVDPELGGLPEGVFDGFLPVNDDSGRGEGFINYLVRPKTGLLTGTLIEAQASIVFDINDPIVTNTFVNRIDDGQPSSSVDALPAVTHTATFDVNWSGLDDADGAPGSGVATYDVYVSENGGPYSLFQTATTSDSASFTGVQGRTYRFFSIATDNVGFTEPYSETVEATTRLAPGVPVLLAPPTTTQSMQPEISWQPAEGAASYDVWISNLSTNASPVLRVTVTGTSFTPLLPLGIGGYRVWVRSLDSAGHPSAWSLPRNFRINTSAVLHALDLYQPIARPAISWDPLQGAVRYEIWINKSTDSVPFFRDTDVETTSWTPAFDFPLGSYRVWVRGIAGADVAAAWSVPRDFLIRTQPVLVSPLGGTFDRTPEFAWTEVAGAVRYDLYVINRNTGATTLHEPAINATSWTPTINLPDGPYRWWVFGVNAQNLYSFASIRTDIYVGGRTELISPVGNTTDSTPTFTWSSVAGAASYSLWVNRIDVPSGVIRETNIEQTQFTPVVALPAGTYRVWVRAVSSTGDYAPWSALRDFQIIEVTQFTPDSLQDPAATFGMDDAVPVMLLAESTLAADSHLTSSTHQSEGQSSTTGKTVLREADMWTDGAELRKSPPTTVSPAKSGAFRHTPVTMDQSPKTFPVTIAATELDDAWAVDPVMRFLDQQTAWR